MGRITHKANGIYEVKMSDGEIVIVDFSLEDFEEQRNKKDIFAQAKINYEPSTYAEGGEIIEVEGFGKYKAIDGEIKVGDMAISENGMLNEYVDEDDDLYFINETHTKVIAIEN